MGHYNSEYEEYYNSLKRKNKAKYNPYNNTGWGQSNTKWSLSSADVRGGYLLKRIIRDLVGVLILFIFVTSCRIIVTPQTQSVYNYSKAVINQSYDYKIIGEKAKKINLNNVQDKMKSVIEQLKTKVGGGEIVKNKIRNEFMMPVEGIVTSGFGYRDDPVTKEKRIHTGIDIDVKKNTEVKAAFGGRVKASGEDGELGKYIVIDHGDGIETKYGHLNEILVKKEDAVKKSQVIAKSGDTGKSTGPHLHFELLYMGENENPEEFFNITKK